MDTAHKDPLVSVIIPTYNCGTFIVEAIQSVLQQTYPHYEIIVVDDGSTDNTQDVVAPHKSRLTYIYQSNQGVVAARNLGIEHAKGDLIAFLDSDDIWFPEKLRSQVSALAIHPEARFAFSDFLEYNQDGVVRQSRVLGWKRARSWYEQHRDNQNDWASGSLHEELLRANWIHTSTLLATKAIILQAGPFDEAFKILQDYDLWLRLARISPGVYVNQVLVGYRHRAEGLSGVGDLRNLRWNDDMRRVLEKHLRKQWVPLTLQKTVRLQISGLLWSVGWAHFHRNDFAMARNYFVRGLRYQPRDPKCWGYLAASLLPAALITRLRSLRCEHPQAP
jgi:glycosyltransferase involved in cell wall biosynthesis